MTIPAATFMVATLKPKRFAALRHIGPHPTVRVAWQRLVPIARCAGLWPPKHGFGSVFSMPVPNQPSESLVSFAVIELGPGEPLPEKLELVELDGGEYIFHRHRGPLDALDRVWPWFWRNARQASGRELRLGPFFETYMGDPGDPFAPVDAILHIPLMPRRVATDSPPTG